MEEENKHRKEKLILIVSIFIAGLCSIIYELLISTASSYFMGDSVKQFSITIGVYMAAMGIGALISRKINKNLLAKFIVVEILLGFIGGMAIPILYLSFSFSLLYYPIMLGLITIIGTLTGLEVPLLTRIMDDYDSLKINLSNVLSLDYFGALLATLIFPFIFLPFFGTFQSSLIFGLINMSIGFLNLIFFAKKLNLEKRKTYYFWSIVVTIFLVLMLLFSKSLLKIWEQGLYEDRVVYAKQSQYQKIVVTKSKNDVRMFLNGNLQFSTIDEHRYHEVLVHIPFSVSSEKKKVLMLGGGDGLGAREMLKYPELESLTIIDIDPAVNDISRKNFYLKEANQGSLDHQKVNVFHQDAFQFLLKNEERYDIIIIDLPDPNNTSLARLYSREFYKLVAKRLKESGVLMTQATSVYFAKNTFWCINRTVKAGGLKYTYPCHAYVPSFGDWGWILASKSQLSEQPIDLKVKTKYLTNQIAQSIFYFEKDVHTTDQSVSSLNKPIILGYYLKDWKHWN